MATRDPRLATRVGDGASEATGTRQPGENPGSADRDERRLGPDEIELVEPWGWKSWLVQYTGPYKSARLAHTRLRTSKRVPWPEGTEPGRRYDLGAPYKSGKAVMRQIVGLYVDGDLQQPAHITIWHEDHRLGPFDWMHWERNQGPSRTVEWRDGEARTDASSGKEV